MLVKNVFFYVSSHMDYHILERFMFVFFLSFHVNPTSSEDLRKIPVSFPKSYRNIRGESQASASPRLSAAALACRLGERGLGFTEGLWGKGGTDSARLGFDLPVMRLLCDLEKLWLNCCRRYRNLL